MAHSFALFLVDAAAAPRQLLDFAAAKALIQRALEINEQRMPNPGIRAFVKGMVEHHFGVLCLDEGAFPEAERRLRRGSELLYKAEHHFPWADAGDKENVANEGRTCLASLLSFLHHTGKTAEARAVYEESLRPAYARALLLAAGEKPRPARVATFSVADVLACPLPDRETVEMGWLWAEGEMVSARMHVRELLPVRLRLADRLTELVGPEDSIAVLCARVVLVDYSHDLPLADVVRLYQQQAGKPRSTRDL